MPDYKALYEQLFDAVTDAIIKLKQVQIDTSDTCSDEIKKERSKKIKADFGFESTEK